MTFGIYSEPLALALGAPALLALVERRWLLAGIIGAVGTAERPTLIVLTVVSGVAAAQAIWIRGEWRALLAAALTPLGMLAFFGYRGRCGRDGHVPPERIMPPLQAGERATLTGFLDAQRATLALKCDHLTDEQLRERAVPPSALSLLGLVRHMAEVERNWFRPLLAGEGMVGICAPVLDVEVAFRDVATADVAESFRTWQAECDHARALTAAAPSLDITGERGGERFTLRWVITHMIEEYARHNGHADLLRERIDGRTGE